MSTRGREPDVMAFDDTGDRCRAVFVYDRSFSLLEDKPVPRHIRTWNLRECVVNSPDGGIESDRFQELWVEGDRLVGAHLLSVSSPIDGVRSVRVFSKDPGGGTILNPVEPREQERVGGAEVVVVGGL